MKKKNLNGKSVYQSVAKLRHSNCYYHKKNEKLKMCEWELLGF